MQRQSLGSPGRTSSLILSDDIVSSKSEDPKRRESSSSSSLTSLFDEIKPEKPLKCRQSQPEKFIHFIPLLMLLCFFILYLSSHDPSPTDLAQFSGFFKNPEKIIDSTHMDEIERMNNENKLLKSTGVVLPIRSLRNLQEEIQGDNSNNITAQKSRSHRKLGDF